jgi:alkylation response protein AidB-like acyl-CoA dehydrogenase
MRFSAPSSPSESWACRDDQVAGHDRHRLDEGSRLMYFTLSPEQRQFSASLHRMLAASNVLQSARRWAGGDPESGRAVWRSLAGAGVSGMAVPREFGGLAAQPADLLIACEELGHHGLPGPVAESLAAVPRLLSAVAMTSGSEATRSGQLGSWLTGLAGGELIATVSAPPLLPFAANADVADLILLAEPGVLRLARAGTTHHSLYAARTLAEVTGAEVIAEGPRVTAGLRSALELGTIACAAQLLGASRALLELTARYAQHRVQFGRPIGSFQAVKHQLADVLIQLELARPLLFGAAISLADESADAPRDVSAAKVACARAANLAGRAALQVHGAIGYTAEHDVSQWLTLIRALGPAWGSQAMHKARVLGALTGQSKRGPSVPGPSVPGPSVPEQSMPEQSMRGSPCA